MEENCSIPTQKKKNYNEEAIIFSANQIKTMGLGSILGIPLILIQAIQLECPAKRQKLA